MSDISIAPVIAKSTWDAVCAGLWLVTAAYQSCPDFAWENNESWRFHLLPWITACVHLHPFIRSDHKEREGEAHSLWKGLYLKLESKSSSCASSPSHLSWSLGEHMAWESRKCSVSAGWIRDGVTGCQGMVMGALAEAQRNLPSKAEHRCWARQGGSLLVKGLLHKSPR